VDWYKTVASHSFAFHYYLSYSLSSIYGTFFTLISWYQVNVRKCKDFFLSSLYTNTEIDEFYHFISTVAAKSLQTLTDSRTRCGVFKRFAATVNAFNLPIVNGSYLSYLKRKRRQRKIEKCTSTGCRNKPNDFVLFISNMIYRNINFRTISQTFSYISLLYQRINGQEKEILNTNTI